MTRPVVSLTVLVSLALACQPPPLVAPEPAAPSPARPEDDAKTPAPQAEPPKAPASPLHVVAVREGGISLMRMHGGLAAVLEGEPLPLVGGVPTRGESGGRGLPTFADAMAMNSILAIGGRLEPGSTAWVATAKEYDRASSWYEVHRNRNDGQGWQTLDLRRGLLAAYDVAYVERDGALFGLRTWSNDPRQDHYSSEEDDPKARAYWRAVQKALDRARTEFVRLEGPEVALPRLPAGTNASAAVTTDDGTIYAIPGGRWGDATSLLVWPAGSTEAQTVALPELTAGNIRLEASGDVALVMGQAEGKEGGAPESYLAVGRGSEWQRIAVSLPGRPANTTPHVLDATRTPAGELWIAMGDTWQDSLGDIALWRKPADGAWEPVPLPAFDDALFGREPGFVYDVTGMEPWGWIPVERASLAGVRPEPTSLAWHDGAVWVVVELGPAYADEVAGLLPRAALLSTGKASASPVRLPSRWELHVERHDVLHRGATPGKEGCYQLWMVLGPASLVDTRPELVKAAQALEVDGAPALNSLYVGRLDGKDVLVGGAYVSGAPQAKALARSLAAATKVEPVIECRIPRIERMVERPVERPGSP